jgi:hypothetical protein
MFSSKIANILITHPFVIKRFRKTWKEKRNEHTERTCHAQFLTCDTLFLPSNDPIIITPFGEYTWVNWDAEC